jgi:nucleoside-diphosphate-sugar epimerase
LRADWRRTYDEIAFSVCDAHVIAADVKEPNDEIRESGPFEMLNVLDAVSYAEVIDRHSPTQIYNLAAMLSATGEKYPLKAWDLNMNGLLNTLELAKTYEVKKIYWPSSIAVFGQPHPVSKHPKQPLWNPIPFMVFPNKQVNDYANGIIRRRVWMCAVFAILVLSAIKQNLVEEQTDYAVDIYFQAKRSGKYTCFLKEGTALPMMYMPDAIRATLELMEAPADQLSIRSAYNLAAMTFAPEEVAGSIQKQLPGFTIDYAPDFRQQIAESWPASIDDQVARKDWGWKHEYDLDKMTADMLANIRQ